MRCKKSVQDVLIALQVADIWSCGVMLYVMVSEKALQPLV